MATKLQHYAQLADQTAIQVTSSYQNWTAFLRTMARLYKYPYHEQLMIFAQRPDATACADYDTWNKQMRRYVRGKNTGIALIDTSGDNPELKYVFDVADTRGGKNARYPYLFQFREEHELAVTHTLADRFEVGDARTLPDLIEEIVNWTMADYWDAHGQDILRIVDGSFLEEYDEENIRFIFHQAAVVSSTYTILSRCGMKPELRYEHLDFMPVFDFNTPQTISALGTAISQTSETVLRQIEVTVKRYEREKHTERSHDHERTDLQKERRLLHPQPEPVRPEPAAADQVREDAENLSEGTPSDPMEQHDSVRDSVPPSAGDRPDSEPAAGADDDRTEEVGGSDGGTENQRPDEMGGADEHLEIPGGGDHSGGADLRLTDDEPPIAGEQFSFFASEAEQIQYIAEAESAEMAPSAFSMPQEYIDQFLRVGSNTDNARTRIAIEYSKQLPREALLSFIQKTYHGGYGLKFGDTKVSAWYAEDGIHITYGDSARYARNAQILSWEDVANRIGELLEEGQFATNVELAEMRSFEQKELAEKLIYLTRDIDREYTDNKYMRIIHDLRGGFPSETEQIKVFLSEPESYGAIMDQLYDLRDAYAQDREIMRFRASNPNKLVPLMEQYAFPRKAYTSEMIAVPEEHPFITEDEIEDALSGGSHYEYTKIRIYDFFHTPHTAKEKLDFLKKEYGTGGGNVALSRNFHSHENYDSRGIRYDKPGCTRVGLPWKKVVKYYDSLMESGHFISPDELVKLREKKAKKEAERQAAKEAEARQEELNKNTAQAINDIKHDHPDDVVLYQVGDFFEIYGDDANTTAPILGLHLSSRALADAGRLNFCGIPAHKLEENLEKLRLHHPVTISAVKEDGSRNTYSLDKLEPPPPVVEEAAPENVAQTIASVGPFWEAYREVKKKHPDYYALVKLNDGYFAFEKDAQAISTLLGLETVNREVIVRKRPVTVCFLPVADFKEHSAAISQTGAGMVLVDRVPGKELETFVILSEKDAAKAQEKEPEPILREVTQADIDHILMEDWGVLGRKERIAIHIRSGKSDAELIDILRTEYNENKLQPGKPETGGFCTLADRSDAYAYYVAAGVRITPEPDGKQREVRYEEMLSHIRRLMDTGRYPVRTTLTQDEIDESLIRWNGITDSKKNVVSYMADHGRERDTAAWLAKEYGSSSELPLEISASDATVSLSWAKVQRRIAQFIKEDRFLTEEEKQQPPFIGTVVEVNHTPYEVIRIDPTDDLGPMAVMRDLTSPEDDPMYSTEPLDYAMVLADPQRELPKQEKPEQDIFEFRGYHFTAVGKLPKGYDINEISKVIASDRELGMSSYDWAKHTYSHYSFYLASGDSQADLFRCLENGKVYLPGDNELFCYTGEYQKLEHTVPPAAQTTPPTVRAIYDQFYPVIRDAVLKDVAYQNACKHSPAESAHIEGNEAVRRAVLDNNDMQLVKLYFGSTKFHNRLHQEIVDETYPVLSNSQPPRYQVVTYHHIENGFDDKKDYRSLEDAEKAAQGYWDGTKEEDGFRYEGAAVYDKQDKKYIRVWGDFPDSRAEQDISSASPAPQIIPRYDPKRFSVRPVKDNPDDLAIWDAAQKDYYSEGGRIIHFDNPVSAENYLHGLQHITGVSESQTLENVVFTTLKGNTFQFGDAFHSDRNEAWREDSVIDYINDSFIWYTIPNEPERPPVKLRRSLFELNLDQGIFTIPVLQEEPEKTAPETDSSEIFDLPDRDPTAPPYAVGDTVYLEETPFIITEIRDHEVQLQDPSLAYPIFRAEPKATFEYLLQQDYRNGAISEFLASDLDEVDPDLQDILTAEGGLLDARDKEIAARWFRSGESNTHIALRLSDTFTHKDGVVELAGSGSADYCGTTLDLKVVIHGDSEARLSFKWDKIAPILRAMYQQERDGFSLEPIQKEPVTLEGVPSYQAGDSVVLPYPDRDIKGTIGYISENGIRIDTGPYSWSHEVLPHNQFEDLLRQDERNSHLFTPEEKVLPAQEVTVEEELDSNPISIQVGGEWKTFPNAKAAEEAAYEEHTANIRRNAQNFHITDDDLGVGGAKAKFQANINAIKLLKSLEAEGAQATPEQQEVLSRYVGWGGVPDAFDPNKANWSTEYQELKDLLTPAEYDAARASTLNAHYTSPTVIRAMYEALGNMGFKTGNVLEPAMGVGNFFGMLPEEMNNSRLYGVELDAISGRIAQQLYPKANITVAGFETTDRRDFYDLAIGNVPFGQYKVNDPAYNKLNFNIHNYFFAKALDQVRPGGVLAFVTSRYTLDAQNANVRKYLAQRADLLGAIRLPNTAFKANAGTEVVSDIIFLQKRDRPIEIEPEWIHLGQTEDGYAINSYFLEHPEMVMGKNSSESTAHGMDYTVEPLEDVSLADQLHEAVQHIRGSYQEAELPDIGEGEAIKETLPADPNVKNYSYTVVDGEVYFRENSIMVKPDLNATAKERIKGMIQLKNCVQNLIEVQMDEHYPDSVIKQYQAELNEVYDNFVAKYGIINNRGNKLAYSDDSSYFLLCALEVMDDEGNFLRKADMFTKRTIQPHRVVTSVETASEALAISIAEKAEVDMEYMSQLCGKTVEEVASDLRGVIFKDPLYLSDPLDGWQTADEYLSGNVRKKLRQAEAAAVDDPAYMVNVEALRAAQPKDLDASEIEVRLGATWIDKSYIQQFMNETFDTPKRLLDTIQVQYSSYTAAWNITNKGRIFYDDVAAYSTYGTDRASAYDILEDSLNLRDVRIYDTVYDDEGKEKRVLNAKETTLASQKQSMIREAFKDWIWRDPDRRQAIVKQYNEEMNSIRPREYDGSHIVFAGMNPEITLREHQRNAIAHTLYGGNTLLAHEVGAGKTFEMVAAAMESKRLGLCQKSIFVVPNHLTEQWASEFLRLYPSANILVTKQRDFEKHNRKKFCARIATGDYDAVIIGHSQFERIPMSQQRQEWILQDQITDITMGIQEVQDNGGEKFTVKQLERTKRGLETRLEKLRAGHRKDDVVTFEQLGVDRLFVDEAHNYKNLFLYTKMQNVAGLSTTDAQKSSDMFAKCRYMDEITGNRGVIFATGTPVSNSMTELYTMQRYLQYAKLDEMGMTHFDCWASRFGETVTALELAPEGKGYRPRTRFSRFFNLPELMNLFKETADIKTADQLNLPVPEVEYHTEVAQPTQIQKNLVQDLSKRAADIHAGLVKPDVDNMLKITSDGRKLGLDQRLINPAFPDEPGTKVNQCVGNILRIWKDGETDKLTQLVFCDISTPQPAAKRKKAISTNLDDPMIHALETSIPLEVKRPFTVYDDIRSKLIANGVPAEQIAFIHDANTDVKKKELFGKVRSGQVRVLLGSTSKMGAGTNCQDRLIAIHDLDCPWRPGDLEQRKGRIVRQGNRNKKVHVFRYVTEGTFDAYLWQTVENKQKFISQIMSSKSPVRACDDVDETALSFAEIKALCAGDPRIKERMDLEVDVSRLKIMKADHQSNQYRLEDNLLRRYPEQETKLKAYIKAMKDDMQTLAAHPHPKDGFAGMTVMTDELVEKDNAGAALIEAAKKATGLDPVTVGTYRGFKMSVTLEEFGTKYVLTMQGKATHQATLGSDPRGNLIRLDNALALMPQRLQALETRLEEVYQQCEAAKAELGKPFPFEEELQDKTARMIFLDVELNLDANSGGQTEKVVAKSERPSILNKLKNTPARTNPGKPQKHHEEVR